MIVTRKMAEELRRDVGSMLMLNTSSGYGDNITQLARRAEVDRRTLLGFLAGAHPQQRVYMRLHEAVTEIWP